MTQEEKAKAYDEALKQIKECVLDDNGFITIYPQEIFPELAESEDERIRKELIRVFSNREKYVINQSFGDINVSDILAWLEKQSEKPADKVEPKFNVGDLIKLSKEPKYPAREIISIKNDGYYFDSAVYLPFERQNDWELVEQKPAWSEEDENRLSDAVFFVREYQIPIRDKRLVNAAKEAEEWLKSLKERYTCKPSDEYIGMQNEIARLKAKLRDYGCDL